MTDAVPYTLPEDLRNLQAQVNLAFADPEYVDTGDLIEALDQALSIVYAHTHVKITKPDHDAETDEDG